MPKAPPSQEKAQPESHSSSSPAPCSTSPYADKGLTWQQAVQWVPEVQVAPGQHLRLTARHDTYAISYSHALGEEPAGPATPCRSGGSLGGSTCSSGSSGQRCGGSEFDGLAPKPSQPARTAVPLADPLWKAAYDRLSGVNEQLVKACVQNPLEYRGVVQAALALAARPHDIGVDAQQAAELCVKLMG